MREQPEYIDFSGSGVEVAVLALCIGIACTAACFIVMALG